MREITWDTQVMPISRKSDAPKKAEFIGIKVGQPDKVTLEEIAEDADRPLGYVARELMLRGLAAYKRDGKLKEPAELSRRKADIPRLRDEIPNQARKRKQG